MDYKSGGTGVVTRHGDEVLFKKTTTTVIFTGFVAIGIFVPLLIIILYASGHLDNSWSITAIVALAVGVPSLILGLGFGIFVFKVTSNTVVFGSWWHPRRFPRNDLVSFRPYFRADYRVDDQSAIRLVGVRSRMGFSQGVRMRFKGVSKDYVFDVGHPEKVCAALTAQDSYSTTGEPSTDN